MTRALYGDTPYGAMHRPTSIGAITRDDMANYHALLASG
jgi:hypothetical protein